MSDPCNRDPLAQQNAQANLTKTTDGEALPTKSRAVRIQAGQAPTVLWDMQNDSGFTLDLSGLGGDYAVVLLLSEAVNQPCPTVIRFEGEILVPAAGKVGAVIAPEMLPGPGIYDAEMAIVDQENAVLYSNTFRLIVERSLFQNTPLSGPPSLMEIRLWLADSSRFENRLLDTLRYDDAEIAAAAVTAVDRWNEALPPVAPHTTQTFPYRAAWKDAIAGQLLLLEAMRRRNNRLPVAAGGVQVDDLGDADAFERLGQAKLAEFTQFCRSRKISLNLELGYGTVGSGYGFGYGL